MLGEDDPAEGDQLGYEVLVLARFGLDVQVHAILRGFRLRDQLEPDRRANASRVREVDAVASYPTEYQRKCRRGVL